MPYLVNNTTTAAVPLPLRILMRDVAIESEYLKNTCVNFVNEYLFSLNWILLKSDLLTDRFLRIVRIYKFCYFGPTFCVLIACSDYDF
jgi:hypothetical protein